MIPLIGCPAEERLKSKAPLPPSPLSRWMGKEATCLCSFLSCKRWDFHRDVMSQMESKLAPPHPKEISDAKALALAKAKLDRVVAQKNKLNRTVAYHAAKMRESEDLLSAKLIELAEVET